MGLPHLLQVKFTMRSLPAVNRNTLMVSRSEEGSGISRAITIPYVHTYVHVYIPTCTHTCIHTHMCTYIHTYSQVCIIIIMCVCVSIHA